eukprot:316600-Pyramimonas_sp.AAC.2
MRTNPSLPASVAVGESVPTPLQKESARTSSPRCAVAQTANSRALPPLSYGRRTPTRSPRRIRELI